MSYGNLDMKQSLQLVGHHYNMTANILILFLYISGLYYFILFISNKYIFCCRSIMQYLQEARAEMKVYQGLKVLVVGSYLCGKTSLVQSLVDQQSRVLEPKDRTVGVDLYDTCFDLEEGQPLGKTLQLSIWDFSGHKNYQFIHYGCLQVCLGIFCSHTCVV